MKPEQIVNAYIEQHNDDVCAEMAEFAKLANIRDAIHHAALCHFLPRLVRHPHQRRIPRAVLGDAEGRLQKIASRLATCRSFEALHAAVEDVILPIHGIGDLAVYDIAHRIGAHLRVEPRLVYLHAGTAKGARRLGLTGKTLDIKMLPEPFMKLSAAKIEDCLCGLKPTSIVGSAREKGGDSKSCNLMRKRKRGSSAESRRRVC